eukprot:6159181-Amphidinium_carterae.1
MYADDYELGWSVAAPMSVLDGSFVMFGCVVCSAEPMFFVAAIGYLGSSAVCLVRKFFAGQFMGQLSAEP